MKHRWAGAVFIAPALLLLLIFYILPIFYSIRLSLFETYLREATWIGLANFQEILRPGPYWDAIRTSGKFLIAVLFADLVVAYLIAIGLSRINPRLAAVLRACYYLPCILSAVVTIAVWRWFFRFEGLFNEVLGAIGIPGLLWLGDPRIAPWALCMALVLGAIGVSVLLYSAALGQLNPDYLEVARLDGANELQVIWYVITPLMRPVMLYILVTNTISAFQIWEHPYFFTKGGPLRSTSTVAFQIFWTAFSNRQFGLASAMTTVTVIFTTIFAWLFIQKIGFYNE